MEELVRLYYAEDQGHWTYLGKAVSNDENYIFNWDTTTMDNGDYLLMANVTDTTGLTAEDSLEIPLEIENPEPVVDDDDDDDDGEESDDSPDPQNSDSEDDDDRSVSMMLVAGIVTRGSVLRYGSAAVMLLAVAKVFLVDLAHLQDLYRVFSLFGLGVSLMLLAYLYQRFVFGAPAVKTR